MALFKILKFKVKGVEHQFRVNVNTNGVFWCEPKESIVKALNLEEKIEKHCFDEVKAYLINKIRDYNS